MFDGIIVIAIALKAGNYVASLLCLGGPLFIMSFPAAGSGIRQVVKRVTIACAILVPFLLMLRIATRSARISGSGLDGMLDQVMLQIVWESPLGTFAVLQILGAFLVFIAIRLKGFLYIGGLIGSLCLASSFAAIGHSLGEPRLILAPLIVIHILFVGFWFASLAPLYRVSMTSGGVVILHRFGVVASLAVPALAVVGLIFASNMLGSWHSLVTTDYGVTLLAKLILVTALLGLAAINKLKLVPEMALSTASAGQGLRRSILLEAGIMCAILCVTAALTSVTTPPANL